MRYSISIAAAIAMLASLPALAEDQPSPKGPPKTMGDEGKLPATGTVGGQVPEMGATERALSPGSETSTPKGPPKTMGEEGKLPATGTMSGEVPTMNPQSK